MTIPLIFYATGWITEQLWRSERPRLRCDWKRSARVKLWVCMKKCTNTQMISAFMFHVDLLMCRKQSPPEWNRSRYLELSHCMYSSCTDECCVPSKKNKVLAVHNTPLRTQDSVCQEAVWNCLANNTRAIVNLWGPQRRFSADRGRTSSADMSSEHAARVRSCAGALFVAVFGLLLASVSDSWFAFSHFTYMESLAQVIIASYWEEETKKKKNIMFHNIIGGDEALPTFCVTCARWWRARERESSRERELERERERAR